MKILSVTSSLLSTNSGSGYSVTSFTNQLKNCGDEVCLIGPEEFEPLRGSSRAVKLRQSYGATRLMKVTQEWRPDLIEFYGDEFGWLLKKIKASGFKIPCIAHSNGFELAELESRPLYQIPTLKNKIASFGYKFFSDYFFGQIDYFVGLSQSDTAAFSRLYPLTPARTIYPGIRGAQSCSVPHTERSTDITVLGSWIPRKGSHLLSIILPLLVKQHPSISIKILGTGNLSDSLLSGNIIVYPLISDEEVAKILSDTKVFLFPSYYEGFGLALAEAMSAGCACIATPTGFAADLKDSNSLQILSTYSAEELLHHIERLLPSSDLRQSLGDKAQESVKELSWAKAGSELSRLYESIISDRR